MDLRSLVVLLAVAGAAQSQAPPLPMEAKLENVWARFGVGSIIETELVTETRVSGEESAQLPASDAGHASGGAGLFGFETGVTRQIRTQTVIRRDSRQVVVRLEIKIDGQPATTGHIMKIPLVNVATAESPARRPRSIGREKVTTPVGEFECAHVQYEHREDMATGIADLWYARGLPVPVKATETATLFDGALEMKRTEALRRVVRNEPSPNPDPAESGRLPFNPSRDAQLGDWAVYTTSPRPQVLNPPSGRIDRVTKVDGNVVVVTQTLVDASGKPLLDPLIVNLSRTDAPIDLDLGGYMDGEQKVGKFVDDPLTIDGRRFACTKLSFSDRFITHGEVWYAPDVKVTGLVLEKRQSGPKSPVDEYVLAGFGASEKTLWGRSPADIFGNSSE